MSIASPATLLLAAALASPIGYQAVVEGGVSVTDVGTRYLICVPVAAVMLMVFRAVIRDFGLEHPQRRATDAITGSISLDKES